MAAVAAGPPAGHNLVLAAGADGVIRAWNVEDGEELGAVSGWNEAFNDVSFVRVTDLDLLIAGGDDGVVRVWNLADGTAVRTLNGHTGWVNAVAALGTAEHGLVASAGEVRALHFADDFADDGTSVLISGGADTVVRTWDALTGAPRLRLPGHQAKITVVTAGPGRTIASADESCAIRTWDGRTGRPLLATHAYRAPARALAFPSASDRPLLAAGYADGMIHVLHATTGQILLTRHARHAGVRALLLTPSTLYAGDDDGTVRGWRLHDGHELLRAKTSHPVLDLAFSPQGIL